MELTLNDVIGCGRNMGKTVSELMRSKLYFIELMMKNGFTLDPNAAIVFEAEKTLIRHSFKK